MKKAILFAVIVGLLVLACTPPPTQTGKGVFMGGTQGLSVKFEPFGVEEAGVFSIFDTETFPLEVTVQNKGEYELKPSDVTVSLLGPSKDEFSGITSWELKNKNTIEKISELVPAGGEETVSFASEAKYVKTAKGVQDRTWFANVDYNYQTSLIVPEVCMKEDLTDKRVCEVKEAKKFFVSGAPITIGIVTQETAGKGIMALKLKVKNVGGGKVTKRGESFGVTEKLGYSLDDAAWECKSGGKVNEARLINGEAEIVCKLKETLAAKTLSTKQVQLTLDYTYREIQQEKLQIKESVK
ncbi:hypothetical protein HYX14_01750 [Candidatus Woesearchaeota archaeon]|nr:hypothetical protein [Candidatus Woesearchaeota archaeon]